MPNQGGGKIMYAMYFVAVGSLAALLFAASMFAEVKKQPEGILRMISFHSCA